MKQVNKTKQNLHVVGVCTIWLTALGTRSKCYLTWGKYKKKKLIIYIDME